MLRQLLTAPLNQITEPHHFPPEGSVADSDGYQTTLCDSVTITPQTLLSLLNVHHLSALEDERYVLGRGRGLDAESVARVAEMIKAPQVHQLLTAPQPGVVVVDGRLDRAQHTARVTPLSFVCASLAHALRQTGAPVLIFFCGRNLRGDDHLQGPEGMMRSLLAQLVLLLLQQRWIEDCAAISLPSYLQGRDGVVDLPLDEICQLFRSLLRVVQGESGLVCIVDGISLFETDAWQEDYGVVMRCLLPAAEDISLPAPFKLLMTSPTSTRLPQAFVPFDRRVSIRNRRGEQGWGAGGLLPRLLANANRDVPSHPQDDLTWRRRTTS